MGSSAPFPGQNEAAVWNKMVYSELCKHSNQVSSTHVEEASNDLNIWSTSNTITLLPELEAKHQKQNFGKVTKSNNGCSKRSRVTQLEVNINENETNDKKGKAKEVGLPPAKCVATEKTQTPKQKNLNGKRGDKRNGKAPKGKCDSFSVKSGLTSFSSAAGGINILGGYGSRPDTEDVTKHVDELSLTELLDDSYKCPSFAKDRGKKSVNQNANILQSLGEAWSILRMRKIKPHIVEIDGGSYQEVPPPSLMTSDSFVASRSAVGDKGDTNMTDLSSRHKYSGSKIKTSANILDFPLYQPKDILEHLTLPPPKDLEVLLQDAAKPAAASRNNSDLRLGKPVSHRGCLPPFSWSNTSSGHCKSNSDAVKLSTSRTTCQGRWVKIENPITSLETTSCFLAELKSLTYDHSLVSSGCQQLVPVRNEKDSPKSVSITEQGLLSSTCPADPQASPAGHSPRVVAASQILCDMAAHSSKQNVYGVIKWLKRPSQKSMRACNLKPNEKSENKSSTPTTKVGFDSMVNTPEEMMPSKKLRLSVNEKSADRVHNNTTAKEPLHWSMPRSSRSSPSKLFRGTAAETKQNSVNIVKKSYMLPPAVRKLDSPCSSQPKPRKLMRMGWNREGGKLE